nr:immunoglobulin light chain junction region [Macaca mulatta]
CRHYYSTPLTF